MPNHERSFCQEYVGKGTGTLFSEGSIHHNWQLNHIFLFKLTAIKCLSRQQIEEDVQKDVKKELVLKSSY